jgi:HD-like signal output (HDOD) protein
MQRSTSAREELGNSQPQCPACKETVPGNSKFCNHCGAKLPLHADPGTAKPQAGSVPAKPPAISSHKAEPEPRVQRGSPYQKSPMCLPTRAERIQACMDHIMGSGDLPALSHHIQSLMGLLGDDNMSLRRLTNIILNDYALTLKIMRAANSVHYNHSGKAIRSVAHAVAMIGADGIRHITGGMLFLEHFKNKSVGLTELLLLSTLTAHHARHLAERFYNSRIEEAHLCGLLRNVGEVLIAYYYPREYASILVRMKERGWSLREACLSVVGFYYEELGSAMAAHWKLPESVSDMLAAARSCSSESVRFNALVDFSHALTSTVYRTNTPDIKKSIRLLIEKHENLFDMNPNQIRALLDSAVNETRETFAALGIPLDHLKLQRQSEEAVSRVEGGEAIAAVTPAEGETGPHGRLIQDLEAEVASTFSNLQDMDLNQAILMVMEAIYRGGPFDRVLLCLVTPDRRYLRGRLGLGDRIDEIIEIFNLPFRPDSDPLIKPLFTKRDLFVPPEGYSCFNYSGLLQCIAPACFGLFPLIAKDLIVGGIYFDRLHPLAIEDPDTLRVIGRLRDLVAAAIERSQDIP